MKFSSYHPVINLIYFAAALTGIILFRHPVFLAISFAASFAWSVKLRGKRGLIFDLYLVPLAANEKWSTGVVDPDHLDAGKFYRKRIFHEEPGMRA